MLPMTASILSFTSEYPRHKKARPVVKMLVVLSHGPANKEVVVENQHVESFVARRITKDHIRVVKGVGNVDISRSMIVSVRGASAWYTNDLSMRRDKQEKNKKVQKRKAEE